jgi:DeoR family transcriptional regulator, suf operon transcriptional repressor
MPQLTPSVAGYRGMRGDILVALKKAQPLTAKELAAQFGVTPNALRRYLKELEEAGVIRYQRQVRGVGGPAFAYVLTGAGEELFPRAYGSVLADALELLREEGGPEAVAALFERRWSAIARAAGERLTALPPDERAAALASLLSAEGFMAAWEEDDAGGGRLTEHNCAIRAVAERFPEVCAAEARFMEAVLGGATVERRMHILGGCNACEYAVRFAAPRGTDVALNAELNAER